MSNLREVMVHIFWFDHEYDYKDDPMDAKMNQEAKRIRDIMVHLALTVLPSGWRVSGCSRKPLYRLSR